MSKILKNTTGSPVLIVDTGITIPASPATYTIDPNDYLLWASSSNIVTEIGSGVIIVNDGSVDLSISSGTDLIKGIFPTSVNANVTASVLPSGASTSAKQDTQIANQSTLSTRVGDLVETSPNTDIASSGLNGRLQRIAQRISSLITGFTSGAYQILLRGGTDGASIGNVGDKLKTVISFGENEQVIDKSNRIRIANEAQLISATFAYNKQPLLFSELITGTGTISIPAQNQGTYLRLNSSVTSGDEIKFGTKRYFRYQANRQHNLNFSFVFGAGDANQETRAGLFSGFNGIYWANLNGNLNIGLRDNIGVVSPNFNESNITKANWNYDKLDGTGPSGLNLTESDLLSNTVTYFVDYLYHGANGVTWGISYFNRRIPVHQLKWTATSSEPFMRSGLLPFQVHVVNTGTLSATTLNKLGPIAYDISGGSENETGYRWSVANGITFKTVTNTFTNIIAVRCKELYNGVRNRGVIVLEDYGLRADNEVKYEIIIGAVVTGGVWTSVGDDSIAEFNVGAFTYTGGRKVGEGFSGSGSNNVGASVDKSFAGDLFISQDSITNVRDSILVRAIRVGANSSASARIGWKEVY